MVDERVMIIGAGGFGREVHDVLVATGTERFIGFVDDSPDRDLLDARGAPWLGGVEVLREHAGATYLVGVGDPRLRRHLASLADEAGLTPGQTQEPRATFGVANRTGSGLVACAGVRVTTNVTIGLHVHLNLNATVGHDAVLGDFVTVNPGANISGSVTLGDDVLVGTGAAIIQGITVGDGAVIGAGAVVTKDVPPAVTAVGVPARWAG